MNKNDIFRKKTNYKKLNIREGFCFLSEGRGYKKTYIQEGRGCILYFERVSGGWNITEERSGCLVGFGLKTLNDAIFEAGLKVESVLNMLNNNAGTFKNIKIKRYLEQTGAERVKFADFEEVLYV